MNEKFEYQYSAEEQAEIDEIRAKYLPPDAKANGLEQLRRLDASAANRGTIAAIVIGVIGTLLLGVGMCCTMEWAENWFFPGILIGLVGIALIGLAYPLYSLITKKRREKIAPEILRLSEELQKK